MNVFSNIDIVNRYIVCRG